MAIPEFAKFPKIPRLNRDIIITEKIDGTNAVIYVPDNDEDALVAGSRSRWLIGCDNFGFAAYVAANSSELRKLGPGVHHGEWWGQGIQRNYNRGIKVFSLFNTTQWSAPDSRPAGVEVVPVLYAGPFDEMAIHQSLDILASRGSVASPGYADPEGIVIFHTASNGMFKVTLKDDDIPKEQAAARTAKLERDLGIIRQD